MRYEVPNSGCKETPQYFRSVASTIAAISSLLECSEGIMRDQKAFNRRTLLGWAIDRGVPEANSLSVFCYFLVLNLKT